MLYLDDIQDEIEQKLVELVLVERPEGHYKQFIDVMTMKTLLKAYKNNARLEVLQKVSDQYEAFREDQLPVDDDRTEDAFTL